MTDDRTRLKTVAMITEIAGGIAVIISLVFFGIQVRHNTAASQAATYQEMIRASNEYLLAIGTDPDLALIMFLAGTDSLRGRMSGRDWLQYGMLRRTFWRNMENAFVQHDRGVLADPEGRLSTTRVRGLPKRSAGRMAVDRRCPST